ncbi:MAG: hypothetical protein ABWZ02_10480 [Nakamurella sp.]
MTGAAASPATLGVPMAQRRTTQVPPTPAPTAQPPVTPPPVTPPPTAPAPAAQAASPLRVQVVICLIGGAGLALVVLGSFLPWVISGNVRRSSYQILGVVGRLGIGDGGALAVLLGAWPFIGVLCVVPVLAAAIRFWRTSGVLAMLIGLLSGLLSFGLLIFVAGRGGSILRIDPVGPSVMAAGAVLLICAAAAMFAWTNSPVRRPGARPLANDQQ